MSEHADPDERNGVEPEQQTASATVPSRAAELRRATVPSRSPMRSSRRSRIAELEDAWRRTAAELDNFRKRCARDVVRGARAGTGRPWPPAGCRSSTTWSGRLEHASSDPDQSSRAYARCTEQALARAGRPRLPAARRHRQGLRPGPARGGRHHVRTRSSSRHGGPCRTSRLRARRRDPSPGGRRGGHQERSDGPGLLRGPRCRPRCRPGRDPAGLPQAGAPAPP